MKAWSVEATNGASTDEDDINAAMTDVHVSNSFSSDLCVIEYSYDGSFLPIVYHVVDVSGLCSLRSAGHPMNGVLIKPRDISIGLRLDE